MWIRGFTGSFGNRGRGLAGRTALLCLTLAALSCGGNDSPVAPSPTTLASPSTASLQSECTIPCVLSGDSDGSHTVGLGGQHVTLRLTSRSDRAAVGMWLYLCGRSDIFSCRTSYEVWPQGVPLSVPGNDLGVDSFVIVQVVGLNDSSTPYTLNITID